MSDYHDAVPLPSKRFKYGMICVTAETEQALQDALGNRYRFDLANCLAKHINGEWGDISDDDKRMNDVAVAHEGDLHRRHLVMSRYTFYGVTIQIATEADRTITTVWLRKSKLYPSC